MNSRQAGDLQVDTEATQIDSFFDSTSEVTKCIVREMFHFSAQAIDGVSASILHVAADEKRVRN